MPSTRTVDAPEDRVREDERRAQAEPAPAPPAAAQVFALQRSMGNHAVGRLLAGAAPRQQVQTLKLKNPLGGAIDWIANKVKASRALDKVKAGKLVSVADWHTMRHALSADDYRSAIAAFDDWKGDEKAKQSFLAKLKPGDLSLFTSQVPSKPKEEGEAETLDERVESSANAERAKQAHQELEALRKDDRSRARITLALVDLLVWGVAEARDAGSDVGGEGIIGIHQAVTAAETLLAMPLPAYVDVVMKLGLTGGEEGAEDWDQRRVESVLILKAVAARKSAFKANAGKAGDEVGDFADAIRGEDADELIERTSTRDIGGGEGLQQKFTMSCGPTSIQIVRGEADPVFAMAVSDEAKHDLDYDSDVGREQAKLLGKAAAPRALDARWKAFKATMNGTTIPAEDVPKWQALFRWLGGRKFNAERRDEGIAAAEAEGFGADELAEFRKYYTGLETEPGLGVSEFVDRVKQAKLAGITNAKHPLKQFKKGAVADKDLEAMYKVLFRGRDILMGVMWNGGGGHYMVLTDVRGDEADPIADREFLLSDPWEGDSQWITGGDLKSGAFGTAGDGWIDDIYY